MMILFGLVLAVLGPLVILTDTAAWPAGRQELMVAACVVAGVAMIVVGLTGKSDREEQR